MRHTGLAELPRGEAGALVAWPSLTDPDVDRYSGSVGCIHGRGRRAVRNERQPPGVAVGHDVDRRTLALVDLTNNFEAILTDGRAVRNVLVRDLVRDFASASDTSLAAGDVGELTELALNSPSQVDGRRTARFEHRTGRCQSRPGRLALEFASFERGEIHPVSG